MSGSLANLDIKVNLKEIKEAVGLLDKLAISSKRVEAATTSMGKAADRAARSSSSPDKQAAKQEKALLSLERGLEKMAKRHEEIQRRLEQGARQFSDTQRRVNQAAIGSDRARLDLLNRLNRAYNEHNKVIGNVSASQKQIGASTRLYENTIKGLNQSITTSITLERQKTQEIKKNAAAQAAAAKTAFQSSKNIGTQSGSYQNLIDKQLGLDTASSNRRTAELNKLRSQIEKSLPAASGGVGRQSGGYQNLIDRQLGLDTASSNRRTAELNKLRSQIEKTLTPATGVVGRQSGGYQSLVDRLVSGGTGQENKLRDYYRRQEVAAETSARKLVATETQLQRALESARNRANNIGLRADRQLTPDAATGVRATATNALLAYENALKNSGTRSLQAAAASGTFQRTMQSLSGEIAKTNGLLPHLDRNARTVSAAFGAANASLGGFSRLVFSTGAALAALSGALGIREIVQASMEFDRFSNTLRTVSGDTAEYRRNLNYLLAEGDRVGFSVSEVGNSFARMSVAMKGAGFNGEQAREAFTNLTEASRNFGLSSADTMGIVRALEQSLSKGKFMAEEVRLQMGDRLPIAMAALSAALTKVDGKVSNVSDRFEAGSIDVQRYALEFTRQINTMSGGASALERTSNTIAAAFGRLSNELTRSLQIFKEEGFDAAVINTTKALTSLLAALRETGVISAFANGIELLSKNLDYLLVVVTALASSWLAKMIFVFARATLALNPLSKAIGILAGGFALLSTAIYGASKGPEEFAAKFTEHTSSAGVALNKLKEIVNEVNSSMMRGFASTASSAKSNFEQMISTFQKAGYVASEAIKLALQAQTENANVEVAKFEKEIKAAEKAADDFFKSVIGFRNRTQINSLAEDATNPVNSIDASFLKKILDDAQETKKNFGEIVKEIENLREVMAASGRDTTFFDTLLGSTDLLSNLKEFKNVNAFSTILADLAKLQSELGLASAELARLKGVSQSADAGVIPTLPDESEMGGPFAPSQRAQRFDITKIAPNAKRAGDAMEYLQKQMRTAYQNQTLLVTKDNLPAYLGKIQTEIQAGGQRAVVAKEIMQKYKEALNGAEKKTGSMKRTLADYNVELLAHTIQNKEVIEAYKESSDAGRRYEDTIEAIREVGKYIKPEYDAAGNAIGKFGEAVRRTVGLKEELTQTERDEAAIKSVNNKEIENEMALLTKERELLGANVAVREEELEVLKKRQELTQKGPISQDILDQAEAQVRSLAKQRREVKFLSDSYEAFANMIERSFDRVAESITDAFARGEISAISFRDIGRAMIADLAQQFLKLSLLNPLMNSLLPSTQVRPTLAGAFGSTDTGAGGLGSLLGIGNLLGGKSIGEALGFTGSSGLFSGASGSIFGTQGTVGASFADLGGITTAGTAGTPGFLGMGGTSLMGGSSLTLGGAALGIGGGMAAGALINSLLGRSKNQTTNGTIASGVGALGGFLVGGPLGAVVGGALGGGLGGMIGPGESVKGYGYNVSASNDQIDPISRKFYNETGAASFAEADAQRTAINAFLSSNQLSVGGSYVVGGNKDGGDYSNADSVSFGEAFSKLFFGSKDNAQLDFAMADKKGRQFGTPEELQAFVTEFNSIKTAFEDMTKEPIPEFNAQMDALNAQFDASIEKIRYYGFSEEKLEEARRKAIQTMQDQRAETLRQIDQSLEYRRLMAAGMTQEAELLQQEENARQELKAFTDQLFSLALTAEETTARLVKLEEVQAAERAAIITKYAKEAAEELTRATEEAAEKMKQIMEELLNSGGNIRNYINDLKASEEAGFSPSQRLLNSFVTYNKDLALAKINDQEALNRITTSSDDYLAAAKDMYASSPLFHSIRDGIIKSLEELPVVKSYDQRIAEGVELSNQLLKDQGIDIEGIYWNTGVEGLSVISTTLLNDIKNILSAMHASLYTIGGVTNDLIYGQTTAMFTIAKVTHDLLFGSHKIMYDIAKVTHDLIFGNTKAQFEIGNVLGVLIFAVSENIVKTSAALTKMVFDIGAMNLSAINATNTNIATLATNAVNIGGATNTLIADMHTSMVAVGNATNTILNSQNANEVNIGNAMNTLIGNMSNALVAVGNVTNTNIASLASTDIALINATNTLIANMHVGLLNALSSQGAPLVNIDPSLKALTLKLETTNKLTNDFLQGIAVNITNLNNSNKTLLSGMSNALVAVGNATNTNINSLATLNVSLINATNTLIGNMHVALVAVGNSTNYHLTSIGVNIVTSMNTNNTIMANMSNALVSVGNATNTNISSLAALTVSLINATNTLIANMHVGLQNALSAQGTPLTGIDATLKALITKVETTNKLTNDVLTGIAVNITNLNNSNKTLLSGMSNALVAVGNATNTNINSLATLSVSLINATNTLIGNMHVGLLAGINATNTILNGLGVNATNIGNSTNTILVNMSNALVAVGNATNTNLGSLSALTVSLINATNTLIASMHGALVNVGNATNTILNTLSTNTVSLGNATNTLISNMHVGLLNALTNQVTPLTDVGSTIKTLTSKIESGTVSTNNILNSILNNISLNVVTALNAVKTATMTVNTTLTSVGGVLNTSIISLSTTLSTLVKITNTSVASMYTGLLAGINATNTILSGLGVNAVNTGNTTNLNLVNMSAALVAVGNAINTSIKSLAANEIALSNGTNLLIGSMHAALLAGINATNTNINTLAVNAKNIGAATNTLIASMHTGLLAGINATNTNVNTFATNSNTIGAATNTLIANMHTGLQTAVYAVRDAVKIGDGSLASINLNNQYAAATAFNTKILAGVNGITISGNPPTFANGGAFSSGNITPFARGGVPDMVNSPHLAPMALFGESGPEAIMPLSRNSQGKLGVIVVGGNAAKNDSDESEFKQYRRQSAAETAVLKEQLADINRSVQELASAINRGNKKRD